MRRDAASTGNAIGNAARRRIYERDRECGGTPHLLVRFLLLELAGVDVRGVGDRPLVFDIGGDGAGLDHGVIDAVQRLVTDVPIAIDVVIEDAPGDAVDVTTFVRRVSMRRMNE